MSDTDMELKVKSITRIEREKKDADIERVKIVARDKEGKFSASFEGPKGSFAGLKAESPITVSLFRSQKTIQEVVEKKQKAKPKG